MGRLYRMLFGGGCLRGCTCQCGKCAIGTHCGILSWGCGR